MRQTVLRYNPRTERTTQELAVLILLVCSSAVLVLPGVLIGAGIALAIEHITTLDVRIKWILASGLGICAFELRHELVVFWPWRLWSATAPSLMRMGLASVHLDIPLVISIVIEALVGPLLFLSANAAITLMRRGLLGQLRSERRRAQQRDHAVHGPLQLPGPVTSGKPDRIRLGFDRETRRLFLLRPDELRHHTFLIGSTGSGKTNTIGCLADGAIALGFGVVIVDCKGGGGLTTTARTLASRWQLPFSLVDAGEPDSLGYDPCTGDASDITNKLIGAFSYGPSAEIYKSVAMSAIPLAIRAMQCANVPITLKSVADSLVAGRMRQIGRQAGEPYHRDLDVLAEQTGVVAEGIAGLRIRLDALLQGKFGHLFTASDRNGDVLDWNAALCQQSVTCINLPATAASEDVELMGRVVAQDLKQHCAKRVRAGAHGHPVVPALVVFDEFAALREAEQVVDFLLQAREAQMPAVVSTQYIPEKLTIRQAVLQAGLIIAHRLEASDAEVIAAQLGTRSKWEPTIQMDDDVGATGMGSLRQVDAYNVHPNDLRTLQRGCAAVRSVVRDEPSIVQVDHAPPSNE